MYTLTADGSYKTGRLMDKIKQIVFKYPHQLSIEINKLAINNLLEWNYLSQTILFKKTTLICMTYICETCSRITLIKWTLLLNLFTLITTLAVLTKVRWSEGHFFSFRSASPHSPRRIPAPLTKLRETDGDIILFVPRQTRRPTPFPPFQFYKKYFVHLTRISSSQKLQ